MSGPKKRAHALLTAGFKDLRCKVDNPKYPSRVWHLRGLFSTYLASRNTGLVRWPRLRWMRIKHNTIIQWAAVARVKCNNQPASQQSCIGERRVAPAECLSSKGFPASTPIPNERAGYRFTGNAVPITYFTELFLALPTALDAAYCPLHIKLKQGEYVTYGTSPSAIYDTESYGRKVGMPANAKVGHNIVHIVNRAKHTHTVGCPRNDSEYRQEQADQICKIN